MVLYFRSAHKFCITNKLRTSQKQDKGEVKYSRTIRNNCFLLYCLLNITVCQNSNFIGKILFWPFGEMRIIQYSYSRKYHRMHFPCLFRERSIVLLSNSYSTGKDSIRPGNVYSISANNIADHKIPCSKDFSRQSVYA